MYIPVQGCLYILHFWNHISMLCTCCDYLTLGVAVIKPRNKVILYDSSPSDLSCCYIYYLFCFNNIKRKALSGPAVSIVQYVGKMDTRPLWIHILFWFKKKILDSTNCVSSKSIVHVHK